MSAQKVLSRTEKLESGCWVFLGTPKDPYGRVSINGVMYLAHRVVYEALRGEIPKDKQIDHLCRNTKCVNPDHLEVVTSAENTFRGISAPARNRTKTHCLRGHKYEADNLREHVRPDGRKYRVCRQCQIDYGKRRRGTLQKV